MTDTELYVEPPTVPAGSTLNDYRRSRPRRGLRSFGRRARALLRDKRRER